MEHIIQFFPVLSIIFLILSISFLLVLSHWKAFKLGEGMCKDHMKSVIEAIDEPIFDDVAKTNIIKAIIIDPATTIAVNDLKYDVLLDLDIVPFFLSAGIGPATWPTVVKDIGGALEENEKNLPNNTNTVIIRAIKLSQSGGGQYLFEPAENLYLKPIVDPPIGT